MDTLKKAGAMLSHLDLFHHMLDLRSLLQLAAHMEERGARATLISPEQITLIGQDIVTEAQVTTSKNATIQATTAYRLLHTLKGHEAPEYAVTREELTALNTQAIAALERSDALQAFADTLSRLQQADPKVPDPKTPDAAPERSSRPRRTSEETPTPEQPAA